MDVTETQAAVAQLIDAWEAFMNDRDQIDASDITDAIRNVAEAVGLGLA
jgi:hypothetical protein